MPTPAYSDDYSGGCNRYFLGLRSRATLRLIAQFRMRPTLKIKSYTIERTSLPDADPNWKISGFAIPTNDGCVVTLTAEDGTKGEGYAAAFAHLGATQEGTYQAVEQMCKRIVGKDAMAIEANMVVVRGTIRGNNPAKGAMDCALHDLVARILKVPLYQILGGKTRSKIPLLRILSIKSPTEVRETAKALIDKGYRYVKIKAAGVPKEDAERVKLVRQAVGDKVYICVDPNQAYRTKSAIEFARRVEEYDVSFLEQPVGDADIAALEMIARNVELPVEADESATMVEQVMDLTANRRVDQINLKIPRSGGILNIKAMARMCEINNIGCRLGANVGSRLLAAHALHVACSLPNIDFACELAEFERLQNDPYEGLEVVDGELTVPDEIGTGVRRRAA